MAIKINFDPSHNPEEPTFILAKRNGDKLGKLNAKNIEIIDCLNDISEISFKVYKYIDNKKCELWNNIVNFKLVYCVEWNTWFEISIELDEATETVKTISGTKLGIAELSQIMLYTIEINTENDISREEYIIPTILWHPEHPEASLLHRIMEKAPHYSVIHVDNSIANIQRTFTFDDKSIYDAFQEIAEELNCLFIFNSNSDEKGKIQRTISVYDLESNCMSCGYRGEFTGVCPKCGGTEINEGFGNDTGIFVTSDMLAENIQLSTDIDSIKNCFKLEGGDDLINATIRNCNPNGTEYIWYFSDDIKSDMSEELIKQINAYNTLYEYYRNDHIVNISNSTINRYNSLVRKYHVYNEDLEEISNPIVGYPALMNAYYNTIDLEWYLRSGLMPTVKMQDTNAIEQAALLTTNNLSPVSAESIKNISVYTADSVILSLAKIIVDSRYRVKVASSTLTKEDTYRVWEGNFVVTNYSDEEDTATSETITVIVDDNYEYFVRQKIEKTLAKDDTDSLDITSLFKKELGNFKDELKKYSLVCLNTFYDSCQTCIDILIEQGIADGQTWSAHDPNLYDDLYIPYLEKLSAIQDEVVVRENELNSITGVYDLDGDLVTYGLQNYIDDAKLDIQDNLDLQKFLGDELWLEFCSYRREDKYSNDNYISDGLTNAELFKKSFELIQVAQKEIYKSAELQKSITSTLKNLLMIDKFKPLINDFQVGNFIRVQIDDVVYKLRLIEYSINYDNLNSISVTFSDVVKETSSIKSVQEILAQASSMATSYGAVQRQAQQGKNSNDIISGWVENGLDATNTKIVGGSDNQSQTWDEHGMLFRKYNSITNTYEPEQLRIINSTIAITNDNWETVKTAIGAYYYFNPTTGELVRAYGVNAEVIVGQLILGKNLVISNDNGSLSFSNDGFNITNGINSFIVNPSSEILLSIKNGDNNVFYIDNNGVLHITADGANIDVSQNTDITDLKAKLVLNDEAIQKEITRATNAENNIVDSLDSLASKEYVEDYVDEEILALADTYATMNYVNNAITTALNNIGVAEEAGGY